MTPESEKKIYKATIVDTNELVKAQARDVADARMTESKEDRTEGNIVTRTLKRMWKHNLAQEWYRQREISRVKKEILDTGNRYAGENEFDPDQKDRPVSDTASKEADQAIIDRFTSEYEEEMLEEEERDSKYVLENEPANSQIKDLIKQYARSEMEPASFEEQKKRILSRYNKQFTTGKSLYADNLLSIANEVRDNIREKGRLAEFDFDIQITLGKARETLSTQAHLNSFDKCIEKMQNNKVGRWIANEPTALAITAGLWEVGRNVLQKTVRSKAVQWGTFGAAALAAGGIGAMKERARITRERAQHQREEAKGMKFKEGDMKRRQEMDENSYDTRKATTIIENLKIDLEKIQQGDISQEERNSIMGDVADLQARLELNREESIDLIVYDKFTVMEKDRNIMREALGELKKELRGSMTPAEFEDQLQEMIFVQRIQLLEGENGIKQKDEIFRKLRNNRAWKAFSTTTLISGTVGALFHEGKMLLHDEMMSHAAMHAETFGDSPTHVQLPNGVTFVENPDTTHNLVKDGHTISSNIPLRFDEHGNLSQETREALSRDGITSDLGMCGGKTSETIHQPVHDYIKDHASEMQRVHRHNFFDQDSKITVKNASKLEWGGVNGTGIDEHGNYVFNVSHMTADGSYHHGLKFDAPEGMKEGHEKMQFALSSDTQHHVYEVPIDSHGNAVIDPNSSLAKSMFDKSDGRAVFHGRFAEAVVDKGIAADGAKNVDVLATYEGQGKEFIDTVVDKNTTVPNVLLHIPSDHGVPLPFGVPGARRPLERGEYEKNSVIKANRSRIFGQEEEEATSEPTPDTTISTSEPTVITESSSPEKKKELQLNEIVEKVKKDGHETVLTDNESNLYAAHVAKMIFENKGVGSDNEAFWANVPENKAKIDLAVRKLKEEAAPAPINLPIKEPGVSEDVLNTIAQKLYEGKEDLSPEELAIYEEYGEDIATRFEELQEKEKENSLENIATMDQALALFSKRQDDIILRDYLINKDLFINTNSVAELVSFYKENHNSDGSIKSLEVKNTIAQIRKIKENGDETWMENTVSKLLPYVASTVKQLGSEVGILTKDRTWAYSDIANAQYQFDTTDPGKRKKDWIGDPLAWNKTNRASAKVAVQKIADRRIAEELLSFNSELKEKIKNTPSSADQKEQEKIDRIKDIIKRSEAGRNIPLWQYGELGRLIRETQNIEPIKL